MTGSGVHPGNEMGKMVKVVGIWKPNVISNSLDCVILTFFFVKNETFYEKPLIMGWHNDRNFKSTFGEILFKPKKGSEW